MAITIDLEDGTGKSTANALVSTETVDTYAETLLDAAGAAWTAEVDEERKKAAVVGASRHLSYSFDWRGTKIKADQALAFPREGITMDGQAVPSDEVPKQVADATAQMAILLLAGSGKAGTTEQEGNVSSVSVGGGAVALNFHEKLGSKTIPEDVSHLLSGWGNASNINTSKGFAIVKATR